ncbi:metalloprotease [Ilumatobacter sp.]|uniref:metalloprotease n=1 Tax=Ilumatobacter sp. TaxID=1967498 RepID=UPI003AF5574B
MFRLLGFDVHVRTGFILFTGLIVFLYQNAFGIWLAGSIAVLTLLHELGHAVAARRAGCRASISLDFLAGYTSFQPSTPLSRTQRAGISIAGPFTQIAISVAVLLAMGVNPLDYDGVGWSDAAAAIWWAGPAIGMLNLIPVLPLDGGHLAMTGLENFVGDRAFRVMAIISIGVTLGAAAFMFGTGRVGFVIFIVFLLVNQFQILQASSRRPGRGAQRSVDVETMAWQTGRPGVLEPGQRLSPWFDAHRALLKGDDGGAMGIVLADLRSPKPGRWIPPAAATPVQLRAVVDTLPAALPRAGNAYSAAVMADVLLAIGEVQRAGEFAATAYGDHRTSTLATTVARSAAAMGDSANAVRWLGAASTTAIDESAGHRQLLARTMDSAPEFSALRSDPTFTALRGELV